MELSKVQLRWFYSIAGVFILAFLAAVGFEFYPILAVPAAMLIAWLLVTSPYKLFLLGVFLVPLSLPLHHFTSGFGLIVPTEPIAALLAITFVLHVLTKRNYDRDFIIHPISLILIAQMTWMLVTAVTSTLPVVSLKYFILRLTYVTVFYFFCLPFLTKEKEQLRFFRLFIFSLTVTIIYVTIRHSQYGFIRDVFIYMGHPFYWNHGIYASTVAFFLPAVLVFIVYGKSFDLSFPIRCLLIMLAGLFLFTELFSFTRAAWLSVLGALVAWVVFEMKVPVKLLFGGVMMSLLLLVVFQKDIMLKLRENEQGSTRKSNLSEHFQSISNIRNDPSNLERINRWNSAIRMFEERPLVGFGPGTYQFKYAPYQRSKDMTVISTNFGVVGHAHSEYLGPLAEGGVFGLLTWIAFFLITLYKGICLIYYSNEKRVKALALSCVLGLLTYYIHGVLNSYIDYDKIAAPLFAFTAMITALDINNRKRLENGLD